MGRRKKYTFEDPGMFSARVEKSDLYKIDTLLAKDRVTVQKFINDVCRLYISGSIILSGSNFIIQKQ